MREPKFKIGDMIFTTQHLINSSDERVKDFNTLFRIPSIAIVCEIIISASGISYVLEEYLKTDTKIDTRREMAKEEDLINTPRNIASVVQYHAENLLASFQILQKEANKNRLNKILHGK